MSTPLSDISSPASTSTRAKRHLPVDKATAANTKNRRKSAKVSRACDHCKSKKLRCSGTLPCEVCTQRAIRCQYEAQYRRGRPPTPPSNIEVAEVVVRPSQEIETPCSNEDTPSHAQTPAPIESSERNPGRAESDESHGLQTAEIGGQIFDPTSNLTFIHRAWKRLALQKGNKEPGVLTGPEQDQPLMSAGDKPFLAANDQVLMFVSRESSIELFHYYFDSCVVTYRVLHQQNCTLWLDQVLRNVAANLPLHENIGHAKAAIVVSILAIASLRQHKTSQPPLSDESSSFLLQQSEQYFLTASNLTTHEIGLPRIESVQARILQVLYLLQTCRMNQAWYVFGSIIPIVSALGLHRKPARHRNGAIRSPTSDYIVSECKKRAFWVVYTIDKYLAVVFGRPRFLHDDDVDQDYPDRVNDEDMTPQGPSLSEPSMDCHIDSLIFHARVAGIIENISREVYSLKAMSNNERLASAQRFTRQLHQWREQLPPHLGTVRPSSLIPCFSRQATALKLAYCHAIMHANRPFLLDFAGELNESALSKCVKECVSAARMALETVDRVFCNEKLFFHALWWTPYVTFCALAVVYVWEIQQKSSGKTDFDDPLLFALAEKCHRYLAEAISSESASKRYSIIIEELRLEARQELPQSLARSQGVDQHQAFATGTDIGNEMESESLGFNFGSVFDEQSDSHTSNLFNPLNQWQPTDWLDLDSSAFSFFSELEGTLIL